MSPRPRGRPLGKLITGLDITMPALFTVARRLPAKFVPGAMLRRPDA